MVTTKFDPMLISRECRRIVEKGGNPIIYTSANNFNKELSSFLNFSLFSVSNILATCGTCGICGSYRGCPIYVTDLADDFWIVVPQHKESIYGE